MHDRPLIKVTGNGPDLVMLHGWGMHSGVWGEVADRLSARWCLHLVDLPGHGTSFGMPLSPDLAELAAMIAGQLPVAHWIGWSMGGLISLQAAIDSPGQIKSLVLVATNPSFVTRAHWPEGVDECLFRDFARELKEDFRGTLNRFLLLETLGSDTARESLRRLKADLHDGHEPDVHSLRSGLSILQNTDYTGLLSGIRHKAFWLAGGRDKLVPPAAMHKAASLMSQGVYHRIAGAGHAPFIGHCDEFIRRLEEFLPVERGQ
jgi:pimeloyl-[acyl-carrier protein] methyl ester esterase